MPDRYEIDEYRMMSNFCRRVADAGTRDELMRAIQGAGAFRCFKESARRTGLIDDWFRFRNAAMEDLAIEWLRDNGIAHWRDLPDDRVGD